MNELNRSAFEPQSLTQAFALPAAFYVDAEFAEQERERIFARHWQLFARSEQLAGSGDHVVGNIAGVPILAVRDETGQLRAFHNVCRHRAGPLALCDGRSAKALRCRYHGWTYRLDGQLRSAPEMNEAEAFDVSQVHLPEIAIAEWQGLVFVALQPAHPLQELLAGIEQRLGERRLEHFEFSGRVSYEIACNWKAYVDNFLEGYHVPHIHPGLNRMLDYRSYRTELANWHSLQHSPLENAANVYGEGEALYWFVWPNMMLNVLPERLQTNRVLPLGVGRCRVEFDYYFLAGSDAARATSDLDFSDAVQHEDIGICEAVQKGLASGSYRAGRLCPRRESGVHHFHELLRAACRAEDLSC
jgi:choline monooxygenase